MTQHTPMKENNVFLFSNLTDQQYGIVNDGVMGGRSQSRLAIKTDKVQFSGTVSLENNGGFASVRMLWPFISKTESNANIAVLKVRGDGNTYQFRLRTNRGFDGAAYSYSFETTEDQVQTIYIPVTDFTPTFRGRKLNNMPKLVFNEVKQMGVLVADYQAGDFEIELISLAIQ